MIGTENRPFAFVSSLTREHVVLRRRLFDLGQQSAVGRYIWVAEESNPTLNPSGLESLAIMDILLDRIRESQLFVAILGGERVGEDAHGTAIDVANEVTAVSHFEAEIFYAAVLGRPVELFVAKPFNPGPRLVSLLEILAFAFPATAWRTPMADDEIVAAVRALVLQEPGHSSNPRQRLVERFYRARGQSDQAGRGLLWLDGQYERRPKLPDKDLITNVLLPEVERQRDQERKLARIWLILRELMAAPPDYAAQDRFGTEFLPLWNRALGLWSGTAAWLGLHGHVYLGGLAGLRSMAQVRAQLRNKRKRKAEPPELAHPGTALCSALYSIAVLAPTRRIREQIFREARSELNATDRTNPRIHSNVLALSGSIHMRQLAFTAAVEDYEAALALREAHAPDEIGRIGESKSELGFAYIFVSRPRDGLRFMEEGVAMMKDRSDPGFYGRGLRKLAQAYKATGHFAEALETEKQAKEWAKHHNLLGQIS